jgi:hypothetical protein
VLLEPKKGTQGREMNRKSWIASTVALLGALSVSLPTVAQGAGPLLSGYGGPGAGEQALIGSTLVGGPSGGAGSGGSSGSAGSGGAGQSSAGQGGPSGNPLGGGSTPAGVGGVHTGSAGGSRSAGGGAGSVVPAGRGAGTSAFVYPSSARSASVGSSALGLSSGDVLALVGILAGLALLGAYTVRLTRLQR